MSAMQSKWIRRSATIITLIVCAFFCAQGLTHLIAAKMPTGDGSVATLRKPFGGLAASRKRDRDPEPILKRNIFASEFGDLTIDPNLVTGDGQEAVAVVITDKPDKSAPSCDGSLRLVAAVHNARNPDWSYAAVSADSKTMLYRKESDINGKRVVEIWPHRIFLTQGSGLCQLQMFAPPEQHTGSGISAAPKLAAKTADKDKSKSKSKDKAITADLMDSNITKISDTKYNVGRSLLDTALQNQGELMKMARLIPHEQGGKMVGVKMYGIRRSSLLGKLGLKNGDLLQNINGFDMSNPGAALEAMTKLMSASNLTVSVTRRGKPVTMEYNVN